MESNADGHARTMTLVLEIRPHDGVGPIALGMTRAQCRSLAGESFSEFFKVPDAERTTDVFFGAMHVYYDDDDQAEFIEVARHADVRAVFSGVSLLDAAAAEAVATVAAHASFDENAPDLGYSYTFKALDLCLWRSVADDDEPEGRTFMAVGVGRRGYYS